MIKRPTSTNGRMTGEAHRLQCAEVWGGIRNADLDVCASGLCASLYSHACEGGRGGDVYYFSVCSHDRVKRLLLADVAGHGDQVAQVSQWFYREMADRLDDPDLPGMVSDLNECVRTRGLSALTTAVVLSYYADLRHVYYCYAGHPPMLVRRGGGPWRELGLSSGRPGNFPLGIDPDVHYDMGEASLAAGDQLLLFSDGVVEAPGADGTPFGTEHLLATLAEPGARSAMDVKSLVLGKLGEWTGGELGHDDVTLIAVQVD